MGDELFREGGEHDIRRTGSDKYSMRINLPPDSEGMLARECPSDRCSPAYFKVKLGTGITGGQTEAFCPYCAYRGEPGDFHTEAQVEYAKQIVVHEAQDGVGRMVKDALDLGPTGKRKSSGGLLSIELSYEPGSRPPVRRPFGEELRRDVTCPICGLQHAVFGIATWCPDCGKDIFLRHVAREYEVLRLMLADVDNRRERLGPRVATRDIENALEDVVSIFEAVLRAITRRRLSQSLSDNEVEDILKKRVANKYQSIDLAGPTALKVLGVVLFQSLNADEIETLRLTFEKRHPITHNLGVVDRKYLEKASSGELEGREVRVTAQDVSYAIDLTARVMKDIYPKAFPTAVTL